MRYSYSAYEALPIWAEFPAYSKKKGYTIFTDSATGLFMDTFGTGQWDYFKDRSERERSISSLRQGKREGHGCCLDIHPTKERLMNQFGPYDNSVLLVDIAGGTSHGLRNLRDRGGSSHGHLVLEDLPEMIKEVDDEKGLELSKCNFFSSLPLIGQF